MNETASSVNDDPSPAPEDMLALVEDQQRSVSGQMGAFVPLILLAWGVAWLGGFTALWLVDGLGEAFSLPIEVAAVVFVLLLIGAGVVSVVAGTRSTRGVRTGKDAAFVGAVYGQAWWIGCLAILGIGRALVFNGMSEELLSIFYPSAYVFFAGVMYVLGAALWRAVPMLVLGLWSIVVSVAAPFAGVPTHFLVFAVAGSAAWFAGAVWTWVWTRRARRRVELRGRA